MYNYRMIIMSVVVKTLYIRYFFCSSSHFWDTVVCRFTAHDWKENFRVSKETFTYLCNQLRSRIQRMNTRMRQAISVEKRLAVTLWSLATPAEYRTIGHVFGIARSTVCRIVHETCKAIVEVLLKKYISFPAGDRLQEVVQGFQSKWGVPQCVGAVDGCHIPVSAPTMCHTDYYNRKGWYSVIIQAVADLNYLFTDIYVGWAGSVHDARVFAHSTLYEKATEGRLLPSRTVNICNVDVPLFLLGDSAYPLQTWLMKPFPESSTNTHQKLYNYRTSRARIVIENAFGRLKGRWRRLMKKNDMNIDNVPHIIAACCVLHNICEVHGESFDSTWAMEDENNLPQPVAPATADGIQNHAKQIRDALLQYFQQH